MFTDGPFFARIVGSDESPTQLFRLDPANGAAANDATKCDAGTNTTRRSFFVKVLETNAVSAAIAAAQDEGWKIDEADMDSNAAATRFIAAGTWTFRIFLLPTVAQTGIGDSDTDVTVIYHRVSSAGIASELFRDAALDQVVGLLGLQVAVSAAHARVDFAEGESLQIEVWLTFPGALVTGQVVTVRLESQVATQHTKAENPGIRTSYTRTLTAPALGNTPAVQRKTGKPLSSSVANAPTMARQIAAARSFAATLTSTPTLAKRLVKNPIVASVTAAPNALLTLDSDLLPSGGNVIVVDED